MKYLFLLLVVMLAGCADGRVLKERCVQGHMYLLLNCAGNEVDWPCWIPKFDDNDKPMKCKVEKND